MTLVGAVLQASWCILIFLLDKLALKLDVCVVLICMKRLVMP